jgi:hypothetical protein
MKVKMPLTTDPALWLMMPRTMFCACMCLREVAWRDSGVMIGRGVRQEGEGCIYIEREIKRAQGAQQEREREVQQERRGEESRCTEWCGSVRVDRTQPLVVQI